ncbi:uncharacterized protein JCM15063_000537 [Sporobolomyces koalae]|uniref:uncharacterized protein n=1 Tax=Sporobolomyces koalae TaxID=500713 RepID=UPI0031781742
MPIPPALYGWFKSNYPSVVFNEDWLGACVDYLQETEEQCKSQTSVLIKSVETQLLSSDLATSISLASLVPNKTILSSAHSNNKNRGEPRTKLFESSRGNKAKGWLFQVQTIDDASHSASSLIQVLQDKRDWDKLHTMSGHGGGRDMRLDDDDDLQQGRDITADEEEKMILAGGNGKEPKFPRGSTKLVLSDGSNFVNAFELQRIQGFGLEELRLGTKLLLHDVPFVNGCLLLTPENTTVKGHDVEELEQFRDWTLENVFRQRLQMDPLPQPEAAPIGLGAQVDDQQYEQPKPKPQDSSEDFFQGQNEDLLLLDEDDIDYDALEQEAISKSQQQPKSQAQQPWDDEDGDEEWDVMNEIEQRQQIPRQKQQPEPRAAAAKKAKTVVKADPRSSGRVTRSSPCRTKADSVEVLELDSDDDRGASVRVTVAKRPRRGPAKVNQETGDADVLEISD